MSLRRSTVHKNHCSIQGSMEQWFLCTAQFWSCSPLLFFIFNFIPSITLRPIYLKRHKWVDLIEVECSAQEALLCTSFFLSYCPLLFFVLDSCPDVNSKTIRAINLKLRSYRGEVQCTWTITLHFLISEFLSFVMFFTLSLFVAQLLYTGQPKLTSCKVIGGEFSLRKGAVHNNCYCYFLLIYHI